MPQSPLRGPQVPGWLRRSVAVAGVLLLAKVVIVLLRAHDGSRGLLTSPLALFALPVEDLEAALLWAGLDALLSLAARRLSFRGEKLRWLAYAAVAIYAASNVPVTRMFATPLTFPILMATDAALLDSLRIYVTAGNVLGIAVVLLGALLLPWWPRLSGAPLWPLSARARLLILSAGLGLWFLGWLGNSRLPLRGLHRNVVFALVRTTLLQRGEQGAAETIEIPPLPAVEAADDAQKTADADLRSLAGRAAGRDVLWVVMESTAARYLKPFGAAEDPTPNLTRLAQDSIAFDAIYAAYPDSIYKGKLPPLLYAIAVVETELDANGNVREVRMLRAPSHAPEVTARVRELIRKASPLPAPARMGTVKYTDTWLVDKSGKFQLDTLTEGQL